MKPYYERDGITIYHGDCRDILPTLEPGSIDLVLTDPPYGMNHEPTRRSNGSKIWGDIRVVGDNEPFNPSALLEFGRCVLFGANWYADKLPPSGGWIVWDKTPDFIREGFTASHAELAWTNMGGMVHKFSLQWGGSMRGGEDIFHPTQKPVALMRWILSKWSNPGDLILDPYMGSGPIARACADLGRRYIGIEIHEPYAEIAANRLQQTVLPMEVA